MKVDTSSLRCWCEIRLDNISHNLRAIRKLVGPKPQIMGLVKADAYGHGIVQIAKFLAKNDCQQLGCAHIAEARMLRAAGVKMPILILSAFLPGELRDIIKLGVQATVSSLDELRDIEKCAQKLKKKALIQVKIDTGMTRLGVFPADTEALFQAASRSKYVKWVGTFTHYSSADSSKQLSLQQFQLFEKYRPKGRFHHSCNSPAILTMPQGHGDMVRPGLCLYGISPIDKYQKLFKPALSWKTRVTFLKSIPKGTPISYNAIYYSKRPMKIATLAVGYGDGFFRALSNQGQVLIQGKYCKILGRVTMDQIIVDVSSLKKVSIGEEVVLIGKQGKNEILASDMAAIIPTIPYEVWCHITDRVPRVYFSLRK